MSLWWLLLIPAIPLAFVLGFVIWLMFTKSNPFQ